MAGGTENRMRLPKFRALVVDDHEAGRLLAKIVLERFGLVVDLATDTAGCDALRQRTDYDVILVDRVLGEEDGLALGMRLATETGAAVVMVSGMTPPETIPFALGGWLCKPYTPRQMYAVVAQALAGYGKTLAHERII